LVFLLSASGVWAGEPEVSVVGLTPPPAAPGERVLAAQQMIVKVTAAGQVSELRYLTDVPGGIREPLARAVKKWQFAPHLDHGVPMAWATQLTVGLNAVPMNGGSQFGMKITVATTSNYTLSGMVPPRYPTDAARVDQGALVCVVVTAAADGRLTVSGDMLVNGSPAAKDDAFATSVRDAVTKYWTAKPLEVDGARYGGEGVIQVPVVFTTGHTRKTSAPVPKDCPVREDLESVNLKLLSKPAGTML